ncbi:MAG: aryl-sulfate sulfotransferase [Planctomycetota bacterium]
MFFLISLLCASAPLDLTEKQSGLLHKAPGAYEGYTLLAPLFFTSVYLLDMEGRVVHTWETEYGPGQATYLMENGHLLRTAFPGPDANPTFHGGGIGGRVQEYTWEGEKVWDFEFSTEDHLLHHDIERMPNGNILMIAWEKKSAKQALTAGRNPEMLSAEGLWPDSIVEVKPKGKTEGEIVWEWHAWDHLVQEFDESKSNYGKVADHPERIHLNPFDWNASISDEHREKLEAIGYLGGSDKRRERHSNPDFMHSNSVDYIAELDQILLSVHGFNEFWIIDHGTSTREAAGHEGGKCGKGGDLLYRWGNPKSYGAGASVDQQLFAQHDAEWIGDGRILVFNNGRGRSDGDYSSVDEIVLPVNEKGLYTSDKGKPFGPSKPSWSYTAPEKSDFFSMFISGAQRLPNGNTLICAGANGVIFEVTPEKETVWKYQNPIKNSPEMMHGLGFADNAPRPGMEPPGKAGMGPGPSKGKQEGRRRPPPGGEGREGPRPDKPHPDHCLFNAFRYGPDYPGLAGRELKPGKSL